jgi:hypothetical protein
MRIIKFRVYDKQTKQWSTEPFICRPGQPLASPDKVWQQFTGAHDKNGQEIYEGDFVKAGDEHVYYCLYANQTSSFVLWFGGEDIPLYSLLGLEVVGNTIDNIADLD